MYYGEEDEENPSSFGVEYLDDCMELQELASIFLFWMRTWNRDAYGNVFSDYAPLRQRLEDAKIGEEHIDTMYKMKINWIEAESEKES